MRSFVLRLADTELAAGRVAGQVEAVQTGQVHPVNGIHDLEAFLLGTGVPQSTEDEGSTRWDPADKASPTAPAGGS